MVRPFETPSAAAFDPVADAYLLAAHGTSGDAGRAIIVRVAAETQQVTNLRWVADGQRGARLEAPSAIALVEGEIWVGDRGVLRRFAREDGARLGDVPLPASGQGDPIVTALAADGRAAIVAISGEDHRLLRVLPGGVVRPLATLAAPAVALGRGPADRWCVVEAGGSVWAPAADEDWSQRDELRSGGESVSGAWIDSEGLVDVEDGEQGRVRVWRWRVGRLERVATSAAAIVPRGRGLGWDPRRHLLLAPLPQHDGLRLQPIPFGG